MSELLRFLRDVDYRYRTVGTLRAMFGRKLVECALDQCLIAQLSWGGRNTSDVELTSAGERYLSQMAVSALLAKAERARLSV